MEANIPKKYEVPPQLNVSCWHLLHHVDSKAFAGSFVWKTWLYYILYCREQTFSGRLLVIVFLWKWVFKMDAAKEKCFEEAFHSLVLWQWTGNFSSWFVYKFHAFESEASTTTFCANGAKFIASHSIPGINFSCYGVCREPFALSENLSRYLQLSRMQSRCTAHTTFRQSAISCPPTENAHWKLVGTVMWEALRMWQ